VSTFRLIAAQKANHPVSMLCELLGVSRAGFYAWEHRVPSDHQLAGVWLLEQIKEMPRGQLRGSTPSCGSRRSRRAQAR
jgi:putative transposase